VPLFTRARNNIQLTPFGQKLVTHKNCKGDKSLAATTVMWYEPRKGEAVPMPKLNHTFYYDKKKRIIGLGNMNDNAAVGEQGVFMFEFE